MPGERWQLLAELRNKKHSCSMALVETALAASGFTKGRSKGHVQVWSLEHLTIDMINVRNMGMGRKEDLGAR
jgi:hypothetical protein